MSPFHLFPFLVLVFDQLQGTVRKGIIVSFFNLNLQYQWGKIEVVGFLSQGDQGKGVCVCWKVRSDIWSWLTLKVWEFFTWSHPEYLKVSHLCLEGTSFWTNLNKARLIFFLMVIESFVNDTSTHFHFYIFLKDDPLHWGEIWFFLQRQLCSRGAWSSGRIWWPV